MQFCIKKVTGSLIDISNTPKSRFVSKTNTKYIELIYKYKGEPNNGRVLLILDFTINKENALERYGIESHVELPYQYPKYFEMLDDSQNRIAIPHSKGIYVIDLEKHITKIVKYKSRDFQYCYFYEIVQNIETGDSQMLIYRRSNLTQLKTLNLSELIKDEDVLKFLDEKRSRKLAFVPNFSYSSIIASWRCIPDIKKNSLIGSVIQWEEPIKKEMHFERVEHFGIIEVELIDSTTTV